MSITETGRHHIRLPQKPEPPKKPRRRVMRALAITVGVVALGAAVSPLVAPLIVPASEAPAVTTVAAAPTTAAIAASAGTQSGLLDHPMAMPTTEEKVVSAHALGFLTSLIKGGVDVEQHEVHIVEVAEAMCSAYALPTKPERDAAIAKFPAAAQALFPDWSLPEAQRFVADTHYFCHAEAGNTHETGHQP